MLKQDKHSAIRRLLVRGADITARTRLTMQYVREGWPKERITPRQRRAIASAITVWQKFPSMCLRLRQIHAQKIQRWQHARETIDAGLLHVADDYGRERLLEGDWVADETSTVTPELFNKLLTRGKNNIDGRSKY